MKYSFDTAKLISEIQEDIEEFGDKSVWAYWFTADNGQEIYFDYFFPDVPYDHHTIQDFDALVKQDYAEFARKQMSASDLLTIFQKESETL